MPSTPTPTLGSRLFVGMQYLLPQHLISRVVYFGTRIRVRWFKNWLISTFVRGFKVDMSDAEQPDPLAFATFNEFFTRALRADARPIVSDPRMMASPVDGTISQIGYLDQQRIIQAKGRHFLLDTLLAGQSQWTERFTGGAFATLYLAPYNYHRMHMPWAGTLRGAWYVPGKLFSVNATTAAAVPDLFARNERVICTFEEGPLAFGLVLVGALNVGSITTVWHGEVTAKRPDKVLELPLTGLGAPAHLHKGDEMGRFNMGSTIVLLFPRDTVEWLAGLSEGTRIKVGQPLARMRGAV